jgi:hypothetical protein
MPNYILLTTVRTTTPDGLALRTAVQASTGDATAVIVPVGGNAWYGKKSNVWSGADIAAAQTALDTTAPLTLQLAAQRTIDLFPIEYRALVLALIDQLNVIRNLLVPVKTPDITPAQAIAAIRTKAGQL